jgi:hypothetical protein
MANDMIGLVGDIPMYVWIALAVTLALCFAAWKVF